MPIDWSNFRTPSGDPWYANTDHKLWTIIHTIVVASFATLFLWITSTNFDATEFKAIGGLSGLFGAYHYLVHMKGKTAK